MDLRKRLVGCLAAMLLALLATTVMISLYSLRDDVAAEVAASEQLARVLRETGTLAADLPAAAAAARLQAILDHGPVRHLALGIDNAGDATDGGSDQRPLHAMVAGWLAERLGVAAAAQSIRVGSHTLRIAPNPDAEIDEKLADSVRLCITLLFFSATTLLLAWWFADRALAPFRQLEAGLLRLARGEADPALPAFKLREFRQVAGAIEHLAAALAASQATQRLLSRQLIRVQEDERRTLARELHDETGQTLTAMGVTAAYLERHAGKLAASEIVECAQDLRRDVRASGQQLRDLLKRLRPHGLDAQGLAGALRELLAGWQQRACTVDFQLELPPQLPPLGDDTGLVLYRVVQEALTNVIRHSGARRCLVQIECDTTLLRLWIVDDGCGLPESGAARGGGLAGMQERLCMVGGSVKLASGADAPFGGLQLQITLPLG